VQAGSPSLLGGQPGGVNENGTQGSSPNQSLGPNQNGNPLGANAQVGSPNQGSAQTGNLNEAVRTLNATQNGGLVGYPNQGGAVFASRHVGDRSNLVDAFSQAAEDLLAESLPIDLKALDQAIEHYLGQIDALGDHLAELLVSDGMWVGLGGVMAAVATGAVVYEWQRRSRSCPFSLVDGGGMSPQWFLESISRE
jgi:hypothetical protein